MTGTFFDNYAAISAQPNFYLGLVLGLQEDSTNTNTDCAKSYNEFTTTLSEYVAYSYADYTAN